MFCRVDGVNAAEVTKKVKAHASDPSADIPSGPAPPKEDLNTKLKRLINTRKCMLFMKGHPDEPKCGFSKQFVAIMKELNAEYGTFDMLTDDEVRQGLKTYSNWPTYPQLYIDGELIGGLDIIKEMVEAGALRGERIPAVTAAGGGVGKWRRSCNDIAPRPTPTPMSWPWSWPTRTERSALASRLASPSTVL